MFFRCFEIKKNRLKIKLFSKNNHGLVYQQSFNRLKLGASTAFLVFFKNIKGERQAYCMLILFFKK